MKKYLRVLYLFPASILATMFYWIYRYMWFSLETVPTERVGVAMLGLFLSTFTLFIETLDD